MTWIARIVRISSYDDSLCFSDCHIPELLTVWGVATLSFSLYHIYQAGYLKSWPMSVFNCGTGWCSTSIGRRRNGYTYTAVGIPASSTTIIPTTTLPPPGVNTVEVKRHKQRTFTYPDTLEHNFFDPDNIPIQLLSYSEVLFPVVQRIAASYGFQVDSSRNQAEHVRLVYSSLECICAVMCSLCHFYIICVLIYMLYIICNLYIL